jgi:DNA-binding CsgD family transcriptional regulator
MHVALPTVAMHLVNARKKLGARTREQAIAQAVKRGLIDA